MSLKTAAIVATALVIVVGFAMISPLFHRPRGAEQRVMLSFSIQEASEIDWSRDLAKLLDSHGIGASVFFTGKAAEQSPESVSYFSDRVDIGSQTYSNTNLTSISDYSIKLQEVNGGKRAVDAAGRLDSRIFRAPFGVTDKDIYSLLSRAGILADFSYRDQYNLYENGQFIRHEAVVYEGRENIPDSPPGQHVIVNFDSTYSIGEIEAVLSRLKEKDWKFINASELAGFSLTGR